MDRILQALLDDGDFRLVSFENQPHGKTSIPDAKIRPSRAVWIETKTKPNQVNRRQIKEHLKSVKEYETLLLLTPDESRPESLDKRVAWSNFRELVAAVEGILGDEDEPASEKEAFLLREMNRMVKEDGLVGSSDYRVLVRAVTQAWWTYNAFSVYYHAGDPSFRPSGYFAFYLGNEVKEKVAKIKSVIKSITLDDLSQVESLEPEQKELVGKLMQRWESKKDKIPQKMRESFQDHLAQPTRWIFLSEPDDEETVKLTKAVINDLKSQGGKRTAFTQNKRYVTLESLEKAQTTSDLEPG